MAAGTQREKSGQEEFIEIDLPEDREYDNPADAELDSRLSEAIEAASKAGNDYLAQLLSFELGSHYYGNGET